MRFIIKILVFSMFLGNIIFAHHQIAYLAPFEKGMVAFMSSGHKLPMGDNFPGLKRYKEAAIIDPSGKKSIIKSAKDMGSFGFSVLPFKENGLYMLSIYSEHYGTKTTSGYFRGTKVEAIKAGRYVVEAKHTHRYSKSYRWNKSGPSSKLRLGHLIEIVPKKLPELIKKGDKITITLYFMGKTAPDKKIGISSMKTSNEIGHPDETGKFLNTVKTDKNGEAVIEMSESGWIILMAENIKNNPEPNVDKLYHSTTTTFWVK